MTQAGGRQPGALDDHLDGRQPSVATTRTDVDNSVAQGSAAFVAHFFPQLRSLKEVNFLHWDMNAGPDNVIRVELDKQSKVLLMDDIYFNSYRSGRSYRYLGGLAKCSPTALVPPHSGQWHVVVNLGGYAGSVRASCSMV